MASGSNDTERSMLGTLAPALFLAGVGLLALVGHVFFFVDPTTPRDWEVAAGAATEKLRDGDLIRVHPTWSEAVFPHLQSVGSRVDRKRRLIPEDLVGVRGFVVIAEDGRRDEALDAMPFEASATEIEDIGSLEVFRIDVPPRETYVLREHLADARVSRRVRGVSRPCTSWDARQKRWDCGKRDRWIYVADELREVGDEPRRCIYAHPLGPEGTLVLHWPKVELGERFRFRSGLDLRAARSARGKDVSVRFSIDGSEVASRRIAHDDYRWHLDEVVTRPGARAVTIEIDAESRHERFVCVDGFVWDDAF